MVCLLLFGNKDKVSRSEVVYLAGWLLGWGWPLQVLSLLHGQPQAWICCGCSYVLQILHALNNGRVVLLHWLRYLLHFGNIGNRPISDYLAA